jgi:uncharacterized integral membrane protein
MHTFFSLIIVVVVLWFAIANAATVTVHLFFWDINASLALVIGCTFILGFLLGVIRLAPGLWSRHIAVRSKERALSETRKERDEFSERSKILEEQVQALAPRDPNDKKID